MPTGSGKTESAMVLINEAYAKGSRVAFIADRLTLVDQTHNRFADYGIPHGVIQAENTRGLGQNIQVCSAQTLEKKPTSFWKGTHLVMIDECHTMRKGILNALKELPNYVIVIGLSASPVTPGMGDYYTNIVNGATTNYLLNTVNPDTGTPYLAPLRIYPATAIDMEGAATVANEWTASAVRERSGRVVGNIVEEYMKMTHLHFGGPVKTLVFSADIPHGHDLCQAFQSAGLDFRQTTYKDSTDDTLEIVQAHKAGEFTGLVSVDKMSKGYDDPTVLCIIDARPNKTSFANVLQKWGRGMRSATGKDYCIASGQRVLTDHGLIPIEQVQLHHLLWDGEGWVSHGGVIFKGVRHVIEYAGLCATPDHQVKTDQGWQALGEAACNQYRIVETARGGQAIREREGYFRSNGHSCVSQWGPERVCPMPMRDLQPSGTYQFNQPQGWAYSRLPKLQPATTKISQVAASSLCSHDSKMPQYQYIRISQLWRAGNRISFQRPQGSGLMDNGKPWNSCQLQRVTNRPYQQRWALRTGQSEMGNTIAQCFEPASFIFGTDAQIQDRESSSTLRRWNTSQTNVQRTQQPTDSRAMEHSFMQTKREVWDILNAGPRNRFTCEGLLVHNCLLLDHAENALGWYEDIAEVWENGVSEFTEAKKKAKTRKEGEERSQVVCKCGYIVPPGMSMCPSCGTERPRPRGNTRTVEGRISGELTEHGKSSKLPDWASNRKWAWEQICGYSDLRFPTDAEKARKYAYANFKQLYGNNAYPPKYQHITAGSIDYDNRVQDNLERQSKAYWARKNGIAKAKAK